ncbi:MAG: hypothetical protein JSR78_15250 [Proteobacteria bacterium]|nr:hypothetical protein [Pseudomonadota bacterium]
MPELSWRTPILAAGLCLVGIETYGSVMYLLSRDGGFSYLVLAGAACTMLSGFLPWIGEKAWKDAQRLAGFFAFCILPLALSTIALAAIERSGSAMDAANMPVTAQSRRVQLADDAIADAKVALDKASAAASAECSTGRGPHCESLESREAQAQAKLDDARAKAGNVGANKTNALTSRLVAMLPLSEDQVTLYEPLVLPLTLSLLSVLCTAIGLGHPNQRNLGLTSPRVVAARAEMLPPTKLGGVAPFMSERLSRAEGKRLAADDLFEAYQGWCASKGMAALNTTEFHERLKLICEITGIRRAKNAALVNVKLLSQ